MEIVKRIAAVIIKDEKMLFVQGKGYEELWTPGGEVDDGETDLECLKRELKEEVNAELLSASFYKEYRGYSFYNPNKELKQAIYIAKITGELKPDFEIESLIWVSREDFLNRKYNFLTQDENQLLPDLIKEGIF